MPDTEDVTILSPQDVAISLVSRGEGTERAQSLQKDGQINRDIGSTSRDDEQGSGKSVTSHEGTPTEEDLKTLRRVSDKTPWAIYTIGFVELCERFSYYGTVAVFTNYIQWPLPEGSTTGATNGGVDGDKQAGAMGFGQRTSTGLTTFNTFWQYTMPLFGAYVADSYLGRYRTINYALGLDIVGHIILTISAIPSVLKDSSKSLAAFIIGIVVIGTGTGGFKPNINPLVIEQLPHQRMRVLTLPSGERVIADPAITASRVYHYFYLFINIGALIGQVSMVYAEYYVGYWLSFSLPTMMLCMCPAVMLWGRHRYRRVPPQGSVLGKAFRLFFRANRGRWSLNPRSTYARLHDGTFWDAVKPSRTHPTQRPAWMDFDDAWVDEVARGFNACAVFIWFPIFWVCYNQISNNLISQAAVMDLNGVPNDVLSNLNPFALIILIPFLDLAVYPALRKIRINVTPIKKITAGYYVAACAMVWACVVQVYIYRLSPCGSYASGNLPNGERCPAAPINVWAQTGSYVLIACAEILASITSLEYAHSKAPKNMRSLVQAVALFMNAIASAIGFALVSLSSDPLLVWNYGVVAVLAIIGGTLFYTQFRHLDQDEDRLNMLPTGHFGGNHAGGMEAVSDKACRDRERGEKNAAA